MILLTQSVHYFNTDKFKDIAKKEIQNILPSLLPLQKGLSFSSYVSDSNFSVVVLNFTSDKNTIQIKAGIFYTGIIAGCSCSDDPSPTDEQNEYCELKFNINKETSEATVKLIEE